MKVVVFGPVPKAGYDTAEDYALPEAHKAAEYGGNIAVLCDGASESYDSRSWARLLAAKFMENPKIDPQWVEDAAAEYAEKCRSATLSWSQEAAFARGSFATLLGLVFEPETGTAAITAIGDSVAFWMRPAGDGASCLESFPYTEAAQFAERPVLLSTNPKRNAAVFTPGLLPFPKQWQVEEQDRILMMTDALAEWTLRNGEKALQELAALCGEADFAALLERERNEKRIRMDDCTLVRITFADG